MPDSNPDVVVTPPQLVRVGPLAARPKLQLAGLQFVQKCGYSICRAVIWISDGVERGLILETKSSQ
jgi:hypothetical protein